MPLHTMRPFYGIVVLWCILALTPSAQGEPAIQLWNPVASVNGFIITPQDLNHEIGQLRWEMDQRNQPLSDTQIEALRPQLIENLIERELLYQQAQQKNIKIRPQWVERELTGVKFQFKDEGVLEDHLARMDMDKDQFRERIRKGLIIRRLIRRDVLRQIKISEKEMQVFYQSHPDLFLREEQVRARHILVALPNRMDPDKNEAALKKIQAIQLQLAQGANFAVLALEYSDCSSKNQGGDVGYFSRNQMVEPFSTAAFDLQPGQISDVVTTRYGYHLIQLLDRRPPARMAYKNTRAKIERTLRRDKEQQKMTTYLANLKRKAEIKRF